MAQINFVPGRGRRARQRRRRLAAVLALGLLCAPPVFLAAENYLAEENRRLRGHNAPLREMARDLDEKLAPARKARRQSLALQHNLAVLQNLQRAAALRAQLLRDLANRNPGGVSCASLSADSEHLRISGAARSGEALAAWLAQLGGAAWFGEPLLEKEGRGFTLGVRHTAQKTPGKTE
ncbi:MAG: PilN domain-containing protein [Gammaproteobacteria bacterium]|nr:PilN domain-containing protein [Gammaproteobacteria bacterium]